MAKHGEKTQKNAIKAYLELGLPLTPLEAWHFFGCYRLASVICKLKKEGMDIIQHIKSDNGKNFAEYHLRLIKK